MEWFLGTLIVFMVLVGVYMLVRGPSQRMCPECGGYGDRPQWAGGHVCKVCHGTGMVPRA
jgi:DnaJ-class molecular chaperone